MRSLVGYLQATAWEHDQIAAWISAIDPEIHEELHACYQGLGKETLKHLYQGPKACHSGLALLINRTEDPHKDLDDARDNWTSTNCWGAFQGGCVVYPELGVKVAMEPGDISLTRAAVLTHFVEEVEHGERFCHVRFTKENILRPTGKVYEDLAIPCPIKGCTRLCPSKATLKKHLRGPSDRARRAKRSPTFHWFGTKEVNQYIAEAMSALELRADEEEEAGESLAHDANEQVEDPPVVG